MTAYTDGMLLHIRVGNSSTGLVTLNFDSEGAKKLFDTAGTQAQDGYLKAGVDYLVVYNAALDGAVGGFTVVNELVHGVMNLRGTFVSAGGGVWPTGAGSGPSGGIRHGDVFIMGDADTLGAKVVKAGDFITTTVDNPGQNDSVWFVIPGPNSIAGVQDFPIASTAWWPRVTAGCSPLAQVEIAGSLVNIQTLDFNQTTQQYAQVRFTFQRKYNLSTITFDVAWSSTASSGSVVWGLSAVALADGDALNTSFGSQVNVTDAVGSANTVRRTAVSGAVTIGNTPAVSDAIFLQITRVTGDASDDMAADARLAEVRIFVPTNAAIDA